jgi:ABC-type multidrug transport system ATPase subunit/pSer/pThr/pTyr-binding forkhead associated (FHA) protein/ABC-type multidrug transport system permease subunit
MNSPDSTGEWELDIGGLCLPVEDGRLVLGRDPDCDLPVADERASWRHLQIERDGAELTLTDLGSKNGTYVNGRRVDSNPVAIVSETIVQLGGTRARLRPLATRSSDGAGSFRRFPIRGRVLRIGRTPDADVRLDEPNVSWHHAELRPGRPPTLVDLGSRNGVRLGNSMIDGRARLPERATAGIGPFDLSVHGDELVVVDERGGLPLGASGVCVAVSERTILNPTTLTVAPGEFVALIGASGSGKTTLLKCLAGVLAPSAGQVVVGPDPIELRLTEVGYVPQSDVVHDRLTVRESLEYAARLRLPSDAPRAECAKAAAQVLEELRLSDHADTRIGRLSGGQRKRVGCGVELIGKPTMLLLDEPTSGLDPPLERRLMVTLRHLADSGRGIVVVTHATSSIGLCDTVAVMGQGGNLLFAGSPAESLEFFGVAAYDEIYGAAELTETPPPVAVPEGGRERRRRGRGLLSGRSLLKHSTALTTRYGRTFARDRRTFVALLAQAPLIALLICLLYPTDILAVPDHQPTRSAQFVFLLITAALWLGLIDSCREIVRERSIIVRELAVGVRLDAHLLAKAVVLFTLAAVQCGLVIAVIAIMRPLHEPTSAYLELTGLLIATSWAMVGVGLVVSTLARSVDQATSFIPVLLIPQLLFGGALVSFARMSAGIKLLADLTVSRWAFAGAGHAIEMNDRLAEAPRVASLSGYGSTFFSLEPWVAATVLLGFTAGMLLLAATFLARRDQEG